MSEFETLPIKWLKVMVRLSLTVLMDIPRWGEDEDRSLQMGQYTENLRTHFIINLERKDSHEPRFIFGLIIL